MKRPSSVNEFGKRLKELRKANGLTMAQLGNKTGVSYRVIAYYELESNHPPVHIIVPLAKALGVTTDELLGVKNVEPVLNPEQASLWRRLKKAESLTKRDRRALLQVLDALVKKNKIS
jgi:transcriptional regulator with XRE-family HTH domain